MEYVGFVQYGTMMEFRDELRQQGEERSFKKGENLIPYLTKNDKLFYLDTGIVYLRLYKPDGSYSQLMAFLPGTILPFINLNRNFPYSDLQMLVAAREEVSGFVFPREYFRKKRKTDIQFAELLEQQWMKSIEYLYVLQLLYREGDAVSRIRFIKAMIMTKFRNASMSVFWILCISRRITGAIGRLHFVIPRRERFIQISWRFMCWNWGNCHRKIRMKKEL